MSWREVKAPRRYRGWVVNATPRPPYPRERDPVPILLEAGWAPRPAWPVAGNLAPTGIRFPARPACSESRKQKWRNKKRRKVGTNKEGRRTTTILQKQPEITLFCLTTLSTPRNIYIYIYINVEVITNEVERMRAKMWKCKRSPLN